MLVMAMLAVSIWFSCTPSEKVPLAWPDVSVTLLAELSVSSSVPRSPSALTVTLAIPGIVASPHTTCISEVALTLSQTPSPAQGWMSGQLVLAWFGSR